MTTGKTNLSFFSGNHSFNADQFTDLDHCAVSLMLVSAPGVDGTEVRTRW